MRVHHLGCGTMCPLGGRVLDGRSPWTAARGRLVCHVLLVETPRSGLVLVDTGFGLDDVAEPRARLGRSFIDLSAPRLAAMETAARQIEELGYRRADVRHIVLTHLDLDHAGGLSDFPDAEVHVHAAELRAAMERATAAERRRYASAQWLHGPRFVTYEADGETWRGFSAVRALQGLPPELLMVPLVGHSRGHCGVVVEAPLRTLLHAGDAYFHEGEMRSPPSCPPGLALLQRLNADDVAQRCDNQARLRALVASDPEGLAVFCAHDEAELSRLRAEA